MDEQCAPRMAPQVLAAVRPDDSVAARRVAAMFDAHFVAVWRFLRRLGVAPGDVDDYAQEVMLIATRKLAQVEVGKERGFLLGVAYRVASDARRAQANRREVDGDFLDDREDRAADPEQLADHQRARALLDHILDGMPLGYRAVFVLAEIEEQPIAEVAAMLGIPTGTVSSRLRRAREHFDAHVKRIQKQLARTGGMR